MDSSDIEHTWQQFYERTLGDAVDILAYIRGYSPEKRLELAKNVLRCAVDAHPDRLPSVQFAYGTQLVLVGIKEQVVFNAKNGEDAQALIEQAKEASANLEKLNAETEELQNELPSEPKTLGKTGNINPVFKEIFDSYVERGWIV